MDFEALFPPLVPIEGEDLSSVDISVDDILLPPLEKAVDDGIYRALCRWNEGDPALTDKTLPYSERIKKYQRIAALVLQSDDVLTNAEENDAEEEEEDEEDEECTETEDEGIEVVARAAMVAKGKAASAALVRQQKARKKLEHERKRIEHLVKELADIDTLRAERVPSTRLQTFVDTFKIKKRRLAQKRSVADTITSLRFDFARPMENAQEEEKQTDKREKPTTITVSNAREDTDVILWFDILHPSKDPARTQSFLVRRSQRLSELVDLIACATDEKVGEHSKASKLVYFGHKFFIDRRVPGALDYSTEILQWIQATPERQTKYGPFRSDHYLASSLHTSTFADLKLLVDVPGVYIHQGECEHLVRLRDARLPHELDSPLTTGLFPMRLPNLLQQTLRNCMICQHYSAKFICYGDRLAVVDPMFFCARCYRTAHYDANGKLLYDDFLSFPFVQD